MIIILEGIFEFIFRDPDLYERSRALVGDFCRVRP